MRQIEAYSYGCVMADVPEPLASRIREFGESIPDADIYDDGSGEYGREKEVHCTVKYGLHTDDPKEVSAVLSQEPPAIIRLGGMSAFHNDKYVVLKLDVQSPDLHRLNGMISRKLECTDSFPNYHPHVTVAYLNHRGDDEKWYQQLYDRRFDGVEFELDNLRFSTADDTEHDIMLTGPNTRAASHVAMMDRVARRFGNAVV